MTWKHSLVSPGWLPFTAALFGSNALDIELTKRSGCGEAQQFGGKDWGKQYATDFAADGVISTMAFFLNKAHFRIIPQAMQTYGIVVHVKGAVDAAHARCR